MLGKSMFFILALFCILPLAAQNAGYSGSNYSSNETAENIIIRELVRSSDRDAKKFALRYLEEAVNSGNITDDIMQALNTIAGDGIVTRTNESRRVLNYPDIRLRACEILGMTNSQDAVPVLLAILYEDMEPAVVTAAIKALGNIGYNENGKVLEMINWVNRKFDAILPTSSLALEILNTYEKLASTTENNLGMIENIIKIAGNYNYTKPVRDRAYEVLRVVWSGRR